MEVSPNELMGILNKIISKREFLQHIFMTQISHYVNASNKMIPGFHL